MTADVPDTPMPESDQVGQRQATRRCVVDPDAANPGDGRAHNDDRHGEGLELAALGVGETDTEGDDGVSALPKQCVGEKPLPLTWSDRQVDQQGVVPLLVQRRVDPLDDLGVEPPRQ